MEQTELRTIQPARNILVWRALLDSKALKGQNLKLSVTSRLTQWVARGGSLWYKSERFRAHMLSSEYNNDMKRQENTDLDR
eukprot:1780410-Amphidinium_carterae.2